MHECRRPFARSGTAPGLVTKQGGLTRPPQRRPEIHRMRWGDDVRGQLPARKVGARRRRQSRLPFARSRVERLAPALRRGASSPETDATLRVWTRCATRRCQTLEPRLGRGRKGWPFGRRIVCQCVTRGIAGDTVSVDEERIAPAPSMRSASGCPCR